MGIEAISQGARSCTFVDHDASVLLFLKKTILDFGIAAQSTVIQKDALKFLKNGFVQKHPFSLIYIDPPYALLEPLNDILRLIKENFLIAPEADVFLEVRKGSFTPSEELPLAVLSKRTYSDSDLWQFR